MLRSSKNWFHSLELFIHLTHAILLAALSCLSCCPPKCWQHLPHDTLQTDPTTYLLPLMYFSSPHHKRTRHNERLWCNWEPNSWIFIDRRCPTVEVGTAHPCSWHFWRGNQCLLFPTHNGRLYWLVWIEVRLYKTLDDGWLSYWGWSQQDYFVLDIVQLGALLVHDYIIDCRLFAKMLKMIILIIKLLTAWSDRVFTRGSKSAKSREGVKPKMRIVKIKKKRKNLHLSAQRISSTLSSNSLNLWSKKLIKSGATAWSDLLDRLCCKVKIVIGRNQQSDIFCWKAEEKLFAALSKDQFPPRIIKPELCTFPEIDTVVHSKTSSSRI